MRTISFILIVLITLVNISCDNYELSDKQADAFIKFYGVGLKDEGIMAITIDEGYLIMGNIENPGRGMDICLIRTDKYGNSTTPIAVYGGLGDDYGYVIKPNESGYIIAGSTQISEGSYKDVFLIQINSNGDTLWTKTYGRSLDDEAYDLVVLEDNSIVLTGYTDSTNVRKKDFLFIEVDAMGNLIDSIKHLGLEEDQVAYSIAQSGNSFLLSGYSYILSASSQQYTKSIYVMRWDGSGSPVPNPYKLGVSSEAVAIKPVNQNEYLLACNVQYSQTSDLQIHLMKVDASGDSTWNRDFGERVLNKANDLLIANNSFYVIGTSSNEDASDVDDFTGDMLLLKTNLNGENPSYFYVGDGASYHGNGCDITSDGGYIITGTNFTSNESVITICKLNTEGSLR